MAQTGLGNRHRTGSRGRQTDKLPQDKELTLKLYKVMMETENSCVKTENSKFLEKHEWNNLKK